ncbi:uncharacterized protein LOC123556017 [Mercenaria mercenaria]|uniref:uncharacterized protein LOC123556017 n=1 Tax=Mercenaria mercenaria TaxID=6596 RepID=UPI00234F0D1C|nr:uncharacterized protein LOC123556017 [Mercenaria mercenaria]
MLILTCGSEINNANAFITIDSSLPPKCELQDFWNVESIGIIDKQSKTDGTLAMEQFTEKLKYEEKRYQVTWPWKSEIPDLPINRELALCRLISTVNRMKNKPDIMKKCNDVVQYQLKKGVIEKVGTNEPDGIIHYLPHHGVITPQKSTTKLRLVYDASSKTRKENLRLNDCLYRGPVMIHDLCGILMRFRMYSITMVADIEKAFLQIGLQRDQRDVTRFMWLKETENPTLEASNIKEYRFCRVPFGIVSSPFSSRCDN